jgi:RHS repeat-associated protein
MSVQPIGMFSTLALAVWFLCIGVPGARAQAREVQYFHLDGLGSVRAVSDAHGQLVDGETRNYLAFGEEWCGTAPCSSVPSGQPKRYTAKERDLETGLDYFGARYSFATRGRFMTIDPSKAVTLANPQSWNRYAYALNNPLAYVDPDGRDAISAEQCAASQACITLPVHVTLDRSADIYDKNGNLLPAYQESLDAQIANARDEYGTIGIYLDVSVKKATTSLDKLSPASSGLNVFVTDGRILGGKRGASGFDNGRPWSLLNIRRANRLTLGHEMAHILNRDANCVGPFLLCNTMNDGANDLTLWGLRGGDAFSQNMRATHIGIYFPHPWRVNAQGFASKPATADVERVP